MNTTRQPWETLATRLQRSVAVAAAMIGLCSSQAVAGIVLVDEDFSVDAGALTGGNGIANFSASGGVGTLTGDGTSTFFSVGVNGISFPELAAGGELIFRVDNLGGAANDIGRFLQVNVDGGNPFQGDQFGTTNAAGLLIHDDDGGEVGSQTIAPGASSLDVLFVTTNGFGANPVPAGEIARLGSFYAEFIPIPEPSSAILLALGVFGLAARSRR